MARTVAANDITEDSVDLRKIYNFEHNEFSYKLPIDRHEGENPLDSEW